MNLNHTVKVVGSVLLSAVMAGSMMPVTVFAQSNDENPTEKTETVYSVLNSDGSISDTIVSSWLHDEDGINNIKETLNLKNVKNIKTSEKPSKDGNTYTWNAKGNDVYYEGDGTQQLPVSVKIRYELDGQEVSAKDIDGKSGHLKLTISFTNNKSETKTIDGKSIIIHPSFLAGGMLNMSTGNFTNVKCDAGKIVNDGSNEILAFANIPGLNETLTSAGLDKVNDQLGISDDVIVEADVNDFDLGSIMIGMTNEIDLSEELGSIDSVSELTDGIDQLMDADEQLIDGSKQLYDGTTQLKEQASPLTSASGQVRELSAGAIQLNDGVKSLQTGLTAYTAGVSSLDAGVSQLYGIPQGAAAMQYAVTTSTADQQSLVDGSQALADGLGQLLDVLNTTDVNASMKQMSELLGTSLTTLTGMQNTLNGDKTTLESMQTDIRDAQDSLTALSTAKDRLKQLTDALEEKENANNQIVEDDNTTIDGVNSQLSTIKSNVQKEIGTSVETLVSARDALAAEGKTDEADKIQTQIDALNAESLNVDKIEDLSSLKKLDSLKNDYDALNGAINGIAETLGSMSTLISDSLDKVNGLSKDVSDAITAVTKLGNDLEKSTSTVSGMKNNIDNMKTVVTKLYNGALALNTGATKLGDSLGDLQSQSKAGIDKVKAGTSQLTANNATLNGGAAQLSEATGTLAGQSGTFNEMADGLDTLGTAFETLNDGAKQLYDGNVQFKSEGLDQLKEKVDLGVGELETLQKVMDEIDSMNKEYSSYSGAPEGATVTSRYVFRTKEESSK